MAIFSSRAVQIAPDWSSGMPYFFNAACQLTTTVRGGAEAAVVVVTRKRFPSAVTSWNRDRYFKLLVHLVEIESVFVDDGREVLLPNGFFGAR
jgi:hypothetical protein